MQTIIDRQLTALLDAAQDVAIIATDPEGRITLFNRGAERLLGCEAAGMLGQPVQQIHLPAHVSMELSAVRDEQGATLGHLGIARDITEQLALQAKLVQSEK